MPEIDPIFELGGVTWVALPSIKPGAHGAFRRIDGRRLPYGGHDHAVIAPIELPARELVVDNHCVEIVGKFALIARVSGEPVPAEHGFSTWTSERIADKGTVVVAGKLEHCRGSFAQPRANPPLDLLESTHDAVAVTKARVAVLSSSNVDAPPPTRDRFGNERLWKESASVDALVARDPHTHVTWVSVHVHDRGFPCDGPVGNVWGLYRVHGKLVDEVAVIDLVDVDAIDALVDLDGDGIPELIGRGAIGPGPIVVASTGAVLLDLTAPSFSL